MNSKVQKLPKGWLMTSIGEISQKITKGTTPTSIGYSFTSSGVSFIKIENLQKGQINSDSITSYISEETHEKLKRSQLHEGDLLISIAGTIGRTAFVTKEVLPALSNNVEHEYLKITIDSYLSQPLHNKARGGAMSNISLKDINEFSFPLPPLNEQKRIVAKTEELFSELDAGEQSLRDARHQLTLYRQSLLKLAFEGKLTEQWRADNPDKLEDPEKLLARIQQERESRHQQQLQTWQQATDEWEENGREGKKPVKPKNQTSIPLELTENHKALFSGVPLSLLSETITKGASPRWQGFDYIQDESETFFITSENVRNGYLDLSKKKFLQSAFNLKQPRSVLKKGDVLYNIVGASIGRCSIFNFEFLANINQAVCLIRPLRLLSSKYLEHFLNHPETLRKNTASAVDVARANLSLKQMGDISIPYCSLPEQQEIVRLLDEQFTAIEQNEKEITRSLTHSQALRQSILKKAFSGSLTK